MKFNHVVGGLLVAGLMCSSSVFAGVEKGAQEWQKKSLKGITSLQYSVAYDPSKELTKSVAASLSPLKVPMKAVNMDDDLKVGTTEGLVKVYVDERKGGQAWVGLTVNQKSHLDRNPAVVYDAETYSFGKLVAKKDSAAAVKDVCAKFVADFTAAK